MAKFLYTSNLETPISEAVHLGRVVLVGKTSLRKRIIQMGVRGGLYVKMNGKKRYISSSGVIVVTDAVRNLGGKK